MSQASTRSSASSSDASKLPTRNELHIIRKVWHMTGGVLLIVVWEVLQYTQQEMTTLLFSLFSAFLLSEVGRRYIAPLNAVILKVAGPLLRQHEVKQFSGSFFFVLGSLLVTAFTPKLVAILSILFLSIGDPIASFFGIVARSLQSLRIQRLNKSLVGSFFSFLVCSSLTYYVLQYHTLPHPQLQQHMVLLCTAGGLLGSLSELLAPLIGVDDNLVIPVVSGAGLWAALLYLGLSTLEWADQSVLTRVLGRVHTEL
mmetsp:Transcript_20388/g.28590  ORF Transcript_20388/g.28590 Transcript_20388/m.28590 type:complete len:256 (+) Transcript_20388:173-940(+)